MAHHPHLHYKYTRTLAVLVDCLLLCIYCIPALQPLCRLLLSSILSHISLVGASAVTYLSLHSWWYIRPCLFLLWNICSCLFLSCEIFDPVCICNVIYLFLLWYIWSFLPIIYLVCTSVVIHLSRFIPLLCYICPSLYLCPCLQYIYSYLCCDIQQYFLWWPENPGDVPREIYQHA